MRRVAVACLVFAVLVAPAPAVAAEPVEGELVGRVAGTSRVETAAAVSALAFPGTAPAVVLARADDHADALAGAPLAARVGGPLLLTGRRLAPAARAEIGRLQPRTAYLLGGEAAVSAEVEREVRGLGVEVVRVAGGNRFDTARRVAAHLPGPDAYVVAGWPDALAVAALAALQERPILLVTRDRLPAETRVALAERRIERVVVIGGTAAVSRQVEQEIAALGVEVRRVGGATRYATSRLLADEAVRSGADPARAWLATGRAFADALAGGAGAAADGGVLVIVDGRDLDGSPDTAAWLAERRGTFTHVRVLGGGVAVPVDTLTQIRSHADPTTRRLRVEVEVEVRDATSPPPFTVGVTAPGTMWNHGRAAHDVVFTGTDGDVAVDDLGFGAVFRANDGRMATAGRGCGHHYDRERQQTVIICTLDQVLIHLGEGHTETRTVRLHAEPEFLGPGRLQPGTYVLDQPVGWARDPDRLHRRDPEERLTIRLTYTVEAADA